MPLRIEGYQQQTSVGQVGIPRRNGPALLDPMGAAITAMANDIQTAVATRYKAQREADLQDRVGRATAEISQLEFDLEKDTDFRTAPQRFKDGANSIQEKYLADVNDQAVATAFRKQFGQISLAKGFSVQKSALGKEKDYNVASLDANLDTYATLAAQAANPAEGALAENQARIAIATAQNGGWISAEEAGKRERGFLNRRDSAVVVRDMGISPMLTATKLSVDPTYVPNVDPVQRERLADQAFRRAEADQRQGDAAAERARKAQGDELLKEAFKRQDAGALTATYVEQIRPYIEPTEYRSLLTGMSGANKIDDPAAFGELQGMVYTNPSMAEARAFEYHRNGRIRNETLQSVLTRARDVSRTEGPRTPYERERLFITNAIKPSDLAPDAAGSARYALVMREYDDYALGGQRTPEELRTAADTILKKYMQIDMVELAKKTSVGARPNPDEQLRALTAEAERLMAQRDAKTITQQKFNQEMDRLNKARLAAERAKAASGK